MKLKDFISETLKEIIDGVSDAQKYYSEKGGLINPVLDFTGADKAVVYYARDTQQIPQFIDFDVAITASEESGTKGGIGVWVGPVGAGIKGKSDTSNTSTNRIKFSIPVILPKG